MFNHYNLLSDIINRILISQKRGFSHSIILFSNFNLSFLKLLKSEGYIHKIFIFFFKFKYIIIFLKYFNNNPVITILKRISKKSLKVYKSYRVIPKFMNGLGIIVVSTNKGLLTDNMCKKSGLGGELLCYVF